MISVVIPTSNSGSTLPATLAALVPAAAEGLVREAIIVDAGSADETCAIADAMGCTILRSPGERGARMFAGATAAKGPWLLFLHPDVALGEGWTREAHSFAEIAEREGRDRAAVFRFALDSFARKARLMERSVALRCALLGLPLGEQGLLIRRRFYEALGGHRPLPAMEDVDLLRRIGRRRLCILRSLAVTNPAGFETSGYAGRLGRDLASVALLAAGLDPGRTRREADRPPERNRAS
jgi:glycosyltransferase involved in cell wall biosynthesis